MVVGSLVPGSGIVGLPRDDMDSDSANTVTPRIPFPCIKLAMQEAGGRNIEFRSCVRDFRRSCVP
jgi:hypothetical protein